MADFNSAFRDNSPAALQARTKVQNRQNVLQMKMMGQAHPTGLTNNLLKLFEARPPLEFKPPPEKRKCPPYTGMAQFVEKFSEPGDPEYAPPPKEVELPSERRARIHKLRLEKGEQKAAEELKKYDPNSDPNVSGDPYKTLFVARLNYETTESKLKREFEAYGPIKRHWSSIEDAFSMEVRLVNDKDTNKPRGYAFIEFLHTRDMKSAYKQADGRKLDNRRVLVDVERGRTVPNWRPRRLGGGLGTTRVGGEELNQKNSGREQQSGPSKSEEPRVREDKLIEREREKSRERGRDREREKSHERPRERDTREERRHRDRDRDRTRDKEKDRGRDRERTRDRDSDRGGRDKDRGRDRDRHREHRDRDREKVKDVDNEAVEDDRGRSRDRGYDYDNPDSKHDSDRHGSKKRDSDHQAPDEEGGWNDLPHQKHMNADPGAEKYDPYELHGGYDAPGNLDRYSRERDYDRYDQMEVDNHIRKRSHSREYEH